MVDRAFIALYAIFTLLSKNNTKKKVLFTSNTCASPVYASIYAGLTPIFSDITLDNYLMDLDETSKLIEKYKDELVAVVYIYTFGHTSADIKLIQKLTRKYGIALIEDVAQAFGSYVDDQKTGTIGDLSVFSFGYSKHIDAGCGGFLINNNPYKYDAIELHNIIENIKHSKSNTEISNSYKKEYYKNRLLVLENDNNYKLFENFHIEYKSMYFKKLNPDWQDVEEKLYNFIQSNEHIERNDRAKRYYDGLTIPALNHRIYAPIVKRGYSVYRYSILVSELKISEHLCQYLRSNSINCSNLYLPVSRYFNKSKYIRSVTFSKRVINLWVDSMATDEYIKHTLNTVYRYFNENK